jgi:DNA-binding response OmpR family regulator
MRIVWITTKIDSKLFETFRMAGWGIKSFTPVDFLSSIPLRYGEMDILVVEAMDRSSLRFCEEICRQQIAPVLAIVADLAYAQAALESGADDFLAAPVEPIEALLRVRKLAKCASIIRVGELEVDLLAWNVRYQGRGIHLSMIEFRLLASLARRVGQLVDYATILGEVWTPQTGRKPMAQVTSYIARVRRKIEPYPQNPQYIISIPGAGYRLRNQRQWQARQYESGKAGLTV